jgi:hypothetical protein
VSFCRLCFVAYDLLMPWLTDFHQTSKSTGHDSSHDYLDESFGLLDTSKERWTNLRKDLRRLNDESDGDTVFKVLFLGRHGQGWHNVAEQHYGSPEWNRYWSKVNTDGNMTVRRQSHESSPPLFY